MHSLDPHSSDFFPSFNAANIGSSKLSGFVVLAHRPLTCYTQKVSHQRLRRKIRSRSDTHPIFPDQELLKVPLDPLEPEQARYLRLHPLIHRLRLIPIHVRLAQHGKRDAVIRQAEGLNRVVVARVLLHELVARETQDDELVRMRGLDFLV